MSKEANEHNDDERRRYVRINKNFILTYHLKDQPDSKYEITQLKNLSVGGMCFVATTPISPDALLNIELKTPYISERTRLTGRVLGYIEKVPNMLYETRTEFLNQTSQTDLILRQLIDFFVDDERNKAS